MAEVKTDNQKKECTMITKQTVRMLNQGLIAKLMAALAVGLMAGGVWLNGFAQQSARRTTETGSQDSMGQGMNHSMMQNMGDNSMMAQCTNMCRAVIFPDSPASILALKDQLGLSEQQAKTVGDIETKARAEARKALTADQQKKFEELTKDWKPQSMTEGMKTMMPQMQQMMEGHMSSGMMMPPAQPRAAAGQAIYTCPMHPEVVQDKPGKCPKCGMNLVEKKR